MGPWHWFGRGTPLSHRRERLYRITRPVFAASTLAIPAGVAAAEEQVRKAGAAGHGEARPVPRFDTLSEAASLLPLGGASALGFGWAMSSVGGFGWLPHTFERLSWVGAFGCGALACAHAAWPALARGEAPGTPCLGPSAALVLLPIIAERLGHRAGLVVSVPLIAIAAATATASACGDPRPSLLAEACTLGYLPLLLACPAVHTHTAHLVFALSWFYAAAAYRAVEDRGQRLKPISHLFLGLGTASLAWGLRVRAPICQY
jgi:hypothetical protein